MIGEMKMPPAFPYRDVFLKGKPKHQKYDDFLRKHPPMPVSRRAKIFAPFNALAGFDEAIASKLINYEPRRELAEDEKEILDRRLNLLKNRILTAKHAVTELPAVTVTYFCPCTDVNSKWYGRGGQYKDISGICRRIETGYITVDNSDISFDDIFSVAGTGLSKS